MKNDKAKAAAKVEALLAEPFTNDEARMQQISEQAYVELLRRAAEQPVKAKKKGLWRSVPALCALVIILMVAPVISTILNPVSYSRANQFVRKATVWVNDTFKLDIELPVEEGETIKQESVTTVFETSEEAAEYLRSNILVIGDFEGNKLESIEVTNHANVRFVTQNYKYHECDVRLTLETVFDRTLDKPTENAILIPTEAGELWMWSADGMSRAIGLIGEWSVDICAFSTDENIGVLFEMLKWLN